MTSLGNPAVLELGPAKQGAAMSHTATWGVALLLLGLVGALFLLASVPPVDRDALTHHLAVPKLYLRYGGIVEIPWVSFSYYPMNLDLLYLVPLYFGNDIFPKFIHGAFALLTAWLIFGYLRSRINVLYALLGALIFLSIPVIVKLAVTVYVDLGLIFFSTAALLGLLRWSGSGFRASVLILSGAACGLALGTKYNGLVSLFCLVLVATWLRVRGGPQGAAGQLRAVGAGALFLAVALLVFSPWAVRNYLWTGNPVYPLYQGHFAARVAGQVDTEVEGGSAAPSGESKPLGHFAQRKLIYGESGVAILTIPLRIFFDGQDDDPRFFDGRLNPALLFLPIVAVLGWGRLSAERRREEQALLMFSLLFLMVVFVQIDMRIRWIAPIIPPLVLLSVFGLRRMELAARGAASKGACSALGLGAGVVLLVLAWGNGAYLVGQFESIRPWPYLSGATSRADYIRQFRGEYPVIEYMNQTLSPDTRILGFFMGGRIYYSDQLLDCRYSEFFSELGRAGEPADILRYLGRQRFTHLLVRQDLFREYIDGEVSSEGRALLERFFAAHTRLVKFANGYALLAVVD